MNYDEFLEIFTPLAEYYGANLTEGAVGLYFKNLKHISKSEFEFASDEIIKSRVYPTLPKVGEILEILRPNIEAIALEEWGLVRYAMERYGSGHSIAFKCKATMKTVELLGGLSNLEMLNPTELEWKRKDFMKIFPLFYGKDLDTLYLMGRYERENMHLLNPPKVTLKLVGFKQSECSLESFLEAQPKPKYIELSKKAIESKVKRIVV